MARSKTEYPDLTSFEIFTSGCATSPQVWGTGAISGYPQRNWTFSGRPRIGTSGTGAQGEIHG